MKKSSCPCSAFLLKTLFGFGRFLKFILIAFLHLLGNSKIESHQSSLPEKQMGEKIPFSDKYYIPDDKFPK